MTHTKAILVGVKRWVQYAEHSLEDPEIQGFLSVVTQHKSKEQYNHHIMETTKLGGNVSTTNIEMKKQRNLIREVYIDCKL